MMHIARFVANNQPLHTHCHSPVSLSLSHSHSHSLSLLPPLSIAFQINPTSYSHSHSHHHSHHVKNHINITVRHYHHQHHHHVGEVKPIYTHSNNAAPCSRNHFMNLIHNLSPFMFVRHYHYHHHPTDSDRYQVNQRDGSTSDGSISHRLSESSSPDRSSPRLDSVTLTLTHSNQISNLHKKRWAWRVDPSSLTTQRDKDILSRIKLIFSEAGNMSKRYGDKSIYATESGTHLRTKRMTRKMQRADEVSELCYIFIFIFIQPHM